MASTSLPQNTVDHCPGPWRVEHTTLDIVRGIITPEEVGAWEIQDCDGGSIAYVPDYDDEPVQVSNARLMAASPDLANALLRTVKHVQVPQKERDKEWAREGHVIEAAAHAALQKAGILP